MTSTRDRAGRWAPGRWGLVALGGMLALAPLAAGAAATDLYYERAMMSAADTRCRLFTPAIGSALKASAAQARGAALRSGIEPAVLSGIEGRAKAKAAATPCNAGDLATAAGRVRNAFEAYSKQQIETYPGEVADWTAARTLGARTATWGLSQTVSFGWDKMVFGLAGANGAASLAASAAFADGASPYSARLVMRDPARATKAYLDRSKADVSGRLPLSARIAPTGYTQAFTIEARGAAPGLLAPAGAKQAHLFRFPAAAAEAMSQLDPREAVKVEFLFSGREGTTVRTAYVEVGDFAAGRAFALAGL